MPVSACTAPSPPAIERSSSARETPEAALVLVGEAPVDVDDLAGRPFVGPAGEKLDGMIAAMGLSRAQVYIGNVMKTRPPDNRTPLGH